MTDADTTVAFLRQIIAHPADDGPRLTFADWCEEHGQGERAEFIRVQCALANRPSIHQIHALEYRAYELLTQHEPDWAGEFMPDARWTYAASDRSFTFRDGGQAIFHWRRGFISQVECRLETWRGRTCNCAYEIGDRAWCSYCLGVGRVGGIGPQLVRRAPVEAVVVSDKRPFIDGQRDHDFCWQRISVTERAWNQRNYPHRFVLSLPNYLYDSIEGTDTGTQRAKYYPSADAANAALSKALLQEARETPLTEQKEKVYS